MITAEEEKTAFVDCVEIRMNCKPISKYRKLEQKEYGLGMGREGDPLEICK